MLMVGRERALEVTSRRKSYDVEVTFFISTPRDL